MMDKHTPTFSIIICLYAIRDRFYDDVKKFSIIVGTDVEVILVTEKNAVIGSLGVPATIVRAQKDKISLGEKRDIGIDAARGEFCAFIDDDAYPHPLWLTNALHIFRSNNAIGAVGGPNVTAPNDNFWERVGGSIYESYCTSGAAQFRFVPLPARDVAELQGVNLIIRKSILDRLGGFHSHLSSGDDTKVCSDVRALEYTIRYDPTVVVYHHRRPFPWLHLKQIKTMGMHRGFFVRAYPETFSFFYCLPLILTIGFFSGLAASFFSRTIAVFYFSLLFLLFVLGFVSVIKRADIVSSMVAALGIIMTHLTYGISFVRGFFKKIEH